MSASYHCHLIDDDADILKLASALLGDAGHRVSTHSDAESALVAILADPPDCIVTDLMMAGTDGHEFCRRLRAQPTLTDTPIVVLSSKGYRADQERARALGANRYLRKPIDPEGFVDAIVSVIEDRIAVTFWGVRGTLPVPGAGSLRYGGNTNCVSLEFADGSLFIFDAGTGIKCLSDQWVAAGRPHLDCHIFISHPHWDHINALPFFAPLYQAGHHICVCGAQHAGITMQDLISAQMDGVYFPITARDFAADVRYRSLHEERFQVGPALVDTMLLNHPGACLGYRIRRGDRTFCYITDNELYPETDPAYDPAYFNKLADFVHGAELLVIDTTYGDGEYPLHRDWGHSPVGEVARLADAAKVKTLCLYHHDPDQDDNAIDRKLADAENVITRLSSKTRVIAPKERKRIWL